MNYMYIVILGLPVFFIIFLTIIACLERRMIWPYGSLETRPQFADSSGYGARWAGDAIQNGYIFLGWASDLKGAIYRVNYGFLISPRRDHLVIIGVGDILKMQLKGTWIYTAATDGRVFYSTDNQSCIHIDVSRQWQTHLAFTGSFAGLLQSHDNLIRDLGITPRSFSAGREMEDFKHLMAEHYQFMARSKLIAFTDLSQIYWRYTFYGALKWSMLNYVIGTIRGLTKGQTPRYA